MPESLIRLHWGHLNGPLKKKKKKKKEFEIWVSLLSALCKPSLASEQICGCPQHASLSLVKFLGFNYNTSNSRSRRGYEGCCTGCTLSVALLGQGKFRIGRADHFSVSGCLWFCSAWLQLLFSFCCRLLKMAAMLQPLKDGRMILGSPCAIERLMECC